MKYLVIASLTLFSVTSMAGLFTNVAEEDRVENKKETVEQSTDMKEEQLDNQEEQYKENTDQAEEDIEQQEDTQLDAIDEEAEQVEE